MNARTLGLWAGLVVLFVAVYWLMGSSDASTRTVVSSWLPVLMLAVFVVVFTLVLRRARGGMSSNNEGLSLLQQGRLLDALAKFEGSVPKMRNPLPLFNIGLTQLQLWRVKAAVKNFEDFHSKANSLLVGVPQGQQLVAPPLALACALTGDVAAAQHWLKQSIPTATAKLAEVVLACRQNDFAKAASALRENEVLLDQLGGTYRALRDSLEAWVVSQTGGTGGEVNLVRLFRESSPDLLKDIWPEFHAFVMRASAGPLPT